MTKKYLWLIFGLAVPLVVIVLGLIVFQPNANNKDARLYVAVEDAGRIDVISLKSQSVTAKIDLSDQESSGGVMYMAHNVQVAPDGKSVWATANAMIGHRMSLKSKVWNELFPSAYAEGAHDEHLSAVSDQVVVINPSTNKIIKRINIGGNLHLAHVVLTPDGKYALVTSQNNDTVYKIDTTTYRITENAKIRAGAMPHGLRVTPDSDTAYVALMGKKSLGRLNLANLAVDYVSLSGVPVQVGITSDGKFVMASVFTSKSIAILDVASDRLRYAVLPKESKGPLQIYPSPDSRYLYVADQGNDFGQPVGNNLYKINIMQAKTVQTIRVGTAPHGVVVAPDGGHTYVSNMESNDVSIVDNSVGKEVARVPVGQKPNGISYWANQ